MKCRLMILVCFFSSQLRAQEIIYPHPVNYIRLAIEGQEVKMAYMDAKPTQPNGKSVLLFHGKNFNGYYWKDVIFFLKNSGYRVIVPDQLGWGRSEKPNIHYSFHLLAANTMQLLDSLAINKVHVIGHSMGGMLATRFALMFPDVVNKLIYENPIGIEDYKTFIPYQKVEEQYEKELKANYDSYKKYQQGYYPKWKPEYEQYVKAQAASLNDSDFAKTAWVNALTYQMIYEQPVVYEFRHIKQPTLIIIGLEDRTVVGKNLLSKEEAAKHGQYPLLGKKLKAEINGSTLIELKDVGHIPHIQVQEVYRQHVLKFLKD